MMNRITVTHLQGKVSRLNRMLGFDPWVGVQPAQLQAITWIAIRGSDK